MASLHFSISFLLVLFSQYVLNAAYTLTPSQSISDGDTLISQGGTFELGFFSPAASSSRRYVGIWYKTIPVQTVVWVANRDAPLDDTSGVLKIDSTGNIIILNGRENIIWSSNPSREAEISPIIELLESGNLVVRDLRNEDSKRYLWQSFDYPGDTLLPGMKLGWNLKTGINRYLSSWISVDDPSHGDYTYGMEHAGYLNLIMRKGHHIISRTGREIYDSLSRPNPIFTYEYVRSADERYYMYKLTNHSLVCRLVLTKGLLQRLVWINRTNNWVVYMSFPGDRCDDYALCGTYGTCDITDVAVCRCLNGFKPKSPPDWSNADWSGGCEREKRCSNGEAFQKYTEMKLPDMANSWVNTSMNLHECKEKCLNNCSCIAFTNTDVRNGGCGCIMWFADLVDVKHLTNGEDLYIRVVAPDLDSEDKPREGRVILIVSITSVSSVIALVLAIFLIWKKRIPRGSDELEMPLFKKKDELELPLYDMIAITRATNNFSDKLGQGGFGPVFKGMLNGGEQIAVKRLSNKSIQGVDQFKNELVLISKLQHRNLVRILGCCIQKDEQMVVYEYMPNNSLDSFIFDETKGRLLVWETRFQIILGIARGLLYLHHDSILKIIHRDLKASNVLLDSEMAPKISDFGMARIFEGNQIEARTKRIAGTRGYMSPEYVLDGRFSTKSDVFSFGVLVLEIISGKRNWGFSHPNHELNLLGHAWRLWGDNKFMDLVDESISSSCSVEEVLRCTHVALLCVQKEAKLRPSMSSVVLMLSSENAVLAGPQAPGFYTESTLTENSFGHDNKQCASSNTSITMLEAR